MPKKSVTANHELADHQLDMQAGSNNAEIAPKPVPGEGFIVGKMTTEELENFKRQKEQEERRNSPWGTLFT